MISRTLSAALRYLTEQQWSVIPINPQSKKALIKWKEFHQRLPTEAEVRSWWKEFPDASVGIVTGRVSNLVVVDVDPDRGGDIEAWRDRQYSDLVATTPRGGAHFYYAMPEGEVRNSVDKVAPGVDVRAHGGYVVAPPSVNYAWFTPWTDTCALTEYIDVLAGEDVTEEETQPKERWLERLLQGVGHGERNDACARLAGYYVKRGIPADVIVQQLLGWNRLNTPPLPESEIHTTVESVVRTAQDNKARATTFTIESDEKDGELYGVTPLGSYLAKYGSEPVNWVVQDWLPEQTVGMVVAPPGSFKTWLLQDLAVSVATGLPFLGKFPVKRTGPVLFMQQEDWHGQIAQRFALIVTSRARMEPPRMSGGNMHVHMPPHLPIYVHEHRKFRFDDKAVVEAWVEQIKRIKPSLVILDPLYSAGSVEDFMAGTAREMFLFKSIRDALGTTFLIAHHTRKTHKQIGQKDAPAQDAAPEREDVWGSQFLNAWMETGWQIRKREELGTASILRHFKVQGDAKRAVLSFHIDTVTSPNSYDVQVRDATGAKDEAADLVSFLEKNGSMSLSALSERAGLHRSTIFRRMENLIVAGVVVKIGARYELTSNLEA